jgi:hypothetical protein
MVVSGPELTAPPLIGGGVAPDNTGSMDHLSDLGGVVVSGPIR